MSVMSGGDESSVYLPCRLVLAHALNYALPDPTIRRANFGEGDVLQHLIDRGHVAMTQHRDQTRLEWQA